MFSKYTKTMGLAFKAQTGGGILYLLPNILVSIAALVPQMFLWTVLVKSGVPVDMSLRQMLSYTYISTLLSELMVVKTFASAWNYEGKLIGLYGRPMGVFGQIIAQTVGAWGPMLLFFSLPMLCIAPVFGVSILPLSPWFFLSLPLCVSLGFAIDFIFVCVTIRLRGMAWLGYSLRMAVAWLFSGAVIPFKLLPFGLAELMEYQPFGSLGGAALSLFVGTGEPFRVIALQLFWNLVLWALAVLWFKKSQERMVSFGG